ncbi:MAG: tRNA pseudouridine(55) synthase TruB [Chloroflexia bacterium]
MEGFVNLHKPSGPTSHDLVVRVRRALGGVRVGHGGTLDPLAEGVLPIGIGRATRLLPFFQEAEKVYRAEIVLGVSTTTYDADGDVVLQCPVPPMDSQTLEETLSAFQGTIEQIPPPFSAVHEGGRRLYERARRGEAVAPRPRLVQIYRLQILAWEPPRLTLEIHCGSGTYVRSLAHDLGERLGCGAYLAALTRLRVGPLILEQALSPERFEELTAHGTLGDALLPLDLPVRHWPAVILEPDQLRALLSGRALELPSGTLPPEAQRARACHPDGSLAALLRRNVGDGLWHPFRVFGP